jgi:hypothetical protein
MGTLRGTCGNECERDEADDEDPAGVNHVGTCTSSILASDHGICAETRTHVKSH